MALSRNMLQQEPNEIEALLPWHAAGTLNARDARRVEEALARDPALAAQYAAIQEEYAATIALNEELGAPSPRAMNRLFAAIDADPSQAPKPSPGWGTRFTGFFASLSPRTMAWSTGLAALALLVQAGVIGTILIRQQGATYQTASLTPAERSASAVSANEPVTRALVQDLRAPAAPAAKVMAPIHALVRFTADARMSDVTALLEQYQASIVDGAKGGMFRLQFAGRSKDDVSALMARLQGEKIVSTAVPTP